MPNRPQQPCTSPGCPRKTRTGRCDTCRTQKRTAYRRRNRRQHDYGPRWPAFRLNYLLANPRCVICARLSTVPDHWPVSRRDLLAGGILDPDQDQYVRPLCKPCHDRQTAIHQPGGWARDRRT